MPKFHLIVILLLLSFSLAAQEPAPQTNKDSSATKDYFSDSSFSALMDLLSDTSFSSFLNTYNYDWFLPDSAKFINVFNTLRPEIDNNYENIKGNTKAVNYYGKDFFVTTEKLPSTYTNYVTQINSFLGKQSVFAYTAPIDSAVSESYANEEMGKWKKLLMKVFPQEAKKMKEVGSDKSDTHSYIFIHPSGPALDNNNRKYNSPGWTMTLRNYVLNTKHSLVLYIEKNE